MNPMLLAALMSFGPAGLSALFGKDPKKDLLKKIQNLLASQPQLAQKYYEQAVGSPAYAAAQGGIAAGANATQGQLGASLGARGIGTSGTGAVLSSMIPSIVGSQQAGLRASAYGEGQKRAQNELQQQIEALQGASGPSQTQQLFAGGLDAFSPLLQNALQNRYPMFRPYQPQPAGH